MTGTADRTGGALAATVRVVTGRAAEAGRWVRASGAAGLVGTKGRPRMTGEWGLAAGTGRRAIGCGAWSTGRSSARCGGPGHRVPGQEAGLRSIALM
jgi:hypothetical protein